MSDSLPVIPIPLQLGDPDATVQLQDVFDLVYQRACYDLSVKYTAVLAPPLSAEELKCVQLRSNTSDFIESRTYHNGILQTKSTW